jgi:hypothetical protein
MGGQNWSCCTHCFWLVSVQHYRFFIYNISGSTVLIRTRASSHMRFLELFRHMVWLLGRVISPSQGLYLHRTTQHRKTRDKHPCLKRDSNPRSQQPTGQDPRLRPHGHCDRLPFLYTKLKSSCNLPKMFCLIYIGTWHTIYSPNLETCNDN